MTKQDPLDEAFSEIYQILVFLQKNKELILGKNVTLEVEKQVDQLEKQVNQFVKETEEMIEKSGAKPAEIKRTLAELDALPADQKEALKRAKELKEKVESLRGEFREAGEEEASSKPQAPKESPKKQTKNLTKAEHRKKYKRLGGKKDWKPM